MPEEAPVEVLLVEDQPQDLELTLRALRKAGVHRRIQIARDGAEALDYLFSPGRPGNGKSAGLPKVVVLDLKLPKLDGLEVLEELRRHPHTETLPVVVLTSSREPRDVARSYQLGANSYIVKPVDCDSFSATVQALGRYWLCLNHPPRCLA
jgi:CheY-like chemotaxis protein